MKYPVELTLNGEVEIALGNMGYVEFDETAPYVNLSGVGIIDITDFQGTFGSIVTSKVCKLDLFVEIGGVWQDYNNIPADYGSITYVSGKLTTIKYTLNASITKLYGKIY